MNPPVYIKICRTRGLGLSNFVMNGKTPPQQRGWVACLSVKSRVSHPGMRGVIQREYLAGTGLEQTG